MNALSASSGSPEALGAFALRASKGTHHDNDVVSLRTAARALKHGGNVTLSDEESTALGLLRLR